MLTFEKCAIRAYMGVGIELVIRVVMLYYLGICTLSFYIEFVISYHTQTSLLMYIP